MNMRIISILIKINFVILTLLIIGLIYNLLSDGFSVLLPGLGLVISGTFILLLMISANVIVTLLLIILRRMFAASP